MGNGVMRVALGLAVAGLLLGLVFGGARGPEVVTVARADETGPAFRGQFIAKMSTEALGEIDQGEWQDWVNYFVDPDHPCTTNVLRNVVYDYYTGLFENLYYNRAARLLALFRGALNREPDEAGFLYYYSGDGAGLQRQLTGLCQPVAPPGELDCRRCDLGCNEHRAVVPVQRGQLDG